MKPGQTERVFAVTAPGLEEVCAGELTALGIDDGVIRPGGVEFSGGLRQIYLANLRVRTATRLIVRLGEFRCRSFPELFRQAVRLSWGRFVKPDTRVTVRATSRRSRLLHSRRLAETLAAAVDHALGREEKTGETGEQLILVRLEDDICTVSLDTSGELLHRRGYRDLAGPAPLRETLAAGLLLLAGWDGREAFSDPLCGSGTLPIEAALLAGRRAPGQGRDFAFMAWPGYRPGLWEELLADARRRQALPAAGIFGGDRSPEAIALASRHAGRASVAEAVSFAVAELDTVGLPPGPGLMLCNPPYGERLGRDQDLTSLFAAIGELCRRGGPGWRCGFLSPDEKLARATGLPLSVRAVLNNGGIRVAFYLSGMSSEG